MVLVSALLGFLLAAAVSNGLVGVSAGRDVSLPRSLLPHSGLTINQELVWKSCDKFGVERPLPGLYCTHVEVPMDYHNSSAGTATLAVIKYTASEPGKSKGPVFMNPGEYRSPLSKIAALISFGKVAPAVLEPWRSPSSVKA